MVYRKICFILFCLLTTTLSSISCFGISDSNDVELSLHENILKNIDAFNIVKRFKVVLGEDNLYKNSYQYQSIYNKYSKFGDILLLTKVYSDLQYPNSEYILAAYNLPRLEYLNLVDSSGSLLSISHSNPLFARDFLVAYKLDAKFKSILSIKFISGGFIKTEIWEDFSNGGFEINNIIKFIKFKCYSMNISKVEYVEKNKKFYFFKIYLTAPIIYRHERINKKHKHTQYMEICDTIGYLVLKFDNKKPDVITLEHKGRLFWKNNIINEKTIFGW